MTRTTKRLSLARSTTGLALALSAAACISSDDTEALDPDPDPDETSEVSQGLISTQIANPNPRPEIGQWGGCTATLIRPNWIIAAAHCWGWFDGRDGAGVNAMPSFATTANGTFAPPAQSVIADRSFAFTGFTGELHTNDVLIARLETAPSLPAGIVPAAIATVAPASGPVTLWGQGCTNVSTGVGSGTLRIFQTTAGTATTNLCFGDSGGPKMVGAFNNHGAIYGINSALGDSFADPMQFGVVIDNLINEWEAHGSEDIYATGWCTAAGERRFEIDADGDNEPDALCFNSSTGQRRLAIGNHRLIRPTWTSSSGWCIGSTSDLLTGDFDADNRSDLLCHHKTTGQNRIDFGSDGYTGTNATLPATTWCTHAAAQLHTGDFDGDHRTDLLCFDRTTGMKWLDLAAASAPIFNGGNDYISTNNFCSHTGAKLLVGDSDGNGFSDLICHTAATGFIHLDRTYAGHKLEGADDDLPPSGGFSFCPTGRVEVGDYDGNKASDLKCVTPTGTWPSVYAGPAGAYAWSDVFGYGGDNAQRTVNAAARPWSYVR